MKTSSVRLERAEYVDFDNDKVSAELGGEDPVIDSLRLTVIGGLPVVVIKSDEGMDIIPWTRVASVTVDSKDEERLHLLKS